MRYFFLFTVLIPYFVFSQEVPIKRVCIEPEVDQVSFKKAEIDYAVARQEYHIIPVVVHIIHDGGQENIPDWVVHRQIDILNEAYGKYGQGDNSNPLSADSKIRFCLTTIDPDGNLTTGINRVKSEYTDLKSEEEMKTKNLSRWPNDRYLNIWVVKSIDKNPSQGSQVVQGYAYLARDKDGAGPKDGVVIDWRFFGDDYGPFQNSFQGETTVHEVGHYLNLLHLWGKKEGDCSEDDLVDDTPQEWGPLFTTLSQPCGNPDSLMSCGYQRMPENYMEYTSDFCLNLFTKGQIARMREAIATFRPQLVSYTNIVKTGCEALYDSLNNNLNFNVQVFPNPVMSKLYINTFEDSSKVLEVDIYDMTGRFIKKVTIDNVTTNEYDLDLNFLRPGLYFFDFKIDGQEIRKKIIKTDRL